MLKPSTSESIPILIHRRITAAPLHSKASEQAIAGSALT
jgi:hypothetical protein